ncbi:MAG TPA: exodeoxyribonuclease VII large subunit [Acidimicrobiales bacterium]|nr:exodeoxyribonuclease VII large subunit [Acidimicrobiales bacterium]
MSDALPLFSEPRKVSLTKLSVEVARSLAGIGKVAVEGEVVKPWRGGNGQVVFTLKDRNAQVTVRCPASRKLRCRVVAGERVQVTGAPEWVPERGQLQLLADEVAPVGEGAIAALIAEVRSKLQADGLLDRPRRRIPSLPLRIGVVCGTDAAVKADIESVVAARFPGYPVTFVPTLVTGSGAADAIARSVEVLDAAPDVEVIILARGGGDGAQLLPWSDEALCRLVAACTTPVVSAIGHEGDRPLCDEVADLRCGTPSLAAGAVVPDRAALHSGLAARRGAVDQVLARRLDTASARLAAVDRKSALQAGMANAHTRLDRVAGRLELLHPDKALTQCRHRLAAEWRQVEALSPVRVLERGYSVVRTADGSVVRRAGQVAPGQLIDVQVAAGRMGARVEETTGE